MHDSKGRLLYRIIRDADAAAELVEARIVVEGLEPWLLMDVKQRGKPFLTESSKQFKRLIELVKAAQRELLRESPPGSMVAPRREPCHLPNANGTGWLPVLSASF